MSDAPSLPQETEAPFAWRAHPAAWDSKALATATEIALMWGRDRSQFVSRIQVAVLDAMRWTTPNHGAPNEAAPPPVDNAFVAVGATRFGDGEIQTEESLAEATEATAQPAELWSYCKRCLGRIDQENASLPEATAQPADLLQKLRDYVTDTKDAKRYRWLRSIDSSSEWNRVGHFAEGAFDAAIDAAIATPEAHTQAPEPPIRIEIQNANWTLTEGKP